MRTEFISIINPAFPEDIVVHLYEKQHSKTGLKYFGKTVGKYPISYPGSGKYWIRHINKHGKDLVNTLRVWEFNLLEDATKFALKFSIDNDIIKSNDWANFKNENALDGGWIKTKGSKGKIWINNGEECRMLDESLVIPIGWTRGLINAKAKGKIWINNGKESIMIKPNGIIAEGWSRGRLPFSNEACQNMSRAQEGRRWINNGVEEISIPHTSEILDGFILGRLPLSNETRQKMSKSTTGGVWINNKKEERINTNNEIPIGWSRGRLYFSNKQ